jgi:ADP-ribose pyrophosphatase YjhB (NUDIX family)
MQAGFGTRHPDLLSVLAEHVPADTHESDRIATAAYVGTAAVPDLLITSVRCLVRVGTEVIVCTNSDGFTHPWPGGKREPGESFEQTAIREVYEETGWYLDLGSLRQLGWLHFLHLRPVPDDYRFPHPDFCQVVFTATASRRAVPQDADWTDTDGYEQESCLMSVQAAIAATAGEPSGELFLRMLAD